MTSLLSSKLTSLVLLTAFPFLSRGANGTLGRRRALLLMDLDRNVSAMSRAGARRLYDHWKTA